MGAGASRLAVLVLLRDAFDTSLVARIIGVPTTVLSSS
jgi:hypothetical protein